jgi:hypothetical protein
VTKEGVKRYRDEELGTASQRLSCEHAHRASASKKCPFLEVCVRFPGLPGGKTGFSRIGVSFVFYTMQLGERKGRDSLGVRVNPMKATSGHVQHARVSSALALFEVNLPVPTDTSRMNSRVEKAKLDVLFSHCSKRIKWAWLIQYHSFQYTQLVYVCSECEQVIKIENAPHAPKVSSGFSDPRLQRKK